MTTTSTRPQLLLVDDTPANLKLYELALKDLDVDLVAVGNGAAAIEQCTLRDFAMILLDVGLPDMDGFAVARAIRGLASCRHTPVVFVSALYTRQEHSLAGYSLGAVDYLTWPLIPEVLRAKAETFVALHRLRLEAEAQAAAFDQAHRQLQASYAELEAFSYSASHDLRAPLRHIAGFSEALLQDYSGCLDDQGRDYLRRIVAAARNMGALIEDLLLLARITRQQVRRQAVDLSAMAEEIAAALAQSDLKRSVAWHIAPGLTAQADPGLARITLVNLLDNAWKFSALQPRAVIEFGRTDQAGETVFFVRDNGIGFDSTAAGDSVFKAFHRMHSSGDFPGTGVGLATAHRVVSMHGGRIWVDSVPERGTSFYFTFQPKAPSALS